MSRLFAIAGTARWRWLLVVLPSVLSAIAVWHLCNGVDALLNGDSIGTIALLHDARDSRGPMSGWMLGNSTGAVPEWLLYIPLALLFGEYRGYALYPLVHVTLFGAFLAALSHAIVGDRFRAALSASLGTLLWVGLLLSVRSSFLLEFLILPSTRHGGVILNGLLFLALLARILLRQPSRGLYVALAIVAVLALISDRYFIVEFLVPSLLLLAALRWRARAPMPVLAWIAGVAAAGILFDAALWAVVRSTHLVSFLRGDIGVSWRPSDWLWELKRSATTAAAFSKANPLVVGLTVVALLLHVGNAVWCVRRPATRERAALGALSALTVLSPLAALAITLYVRMWVDVQSLRYVLPLFALPIPFLALLAVNGEESGFQLLRGPLVAGAIVAGGACLATLPSLQPIPDEFPYPSDVACLDRLARSQGLRYGYGDYWSAKLFTLESRHGVIVNQLRRDLTLQHEFNNIAWYLEWVPSTGAFAIPAYRFIITNRLRTPAITKAFGEPAARHRCGLMSVWVYGRDSDAAFRKHIVSILQPFRRVLKEHLDNLPSELR